MSKKQQSVWRFTVVNHFTLEKIDEVFVLGDTLKSAELHLRELFSEYFYDIDDVTLMSNPRLVIVGTSIYKPLLS